MKLINTGLNRVIKKALFKMEKNSPEILVGLGIVGGITASVLACKATIKAQDILAEAKNNIDAIHEATELDAAQKTDYNEENRRRDLTTAYIQAGLGLAKTYALPVAIGAVSIISIVASHGILKNRVATLVTAYGTLDTAFRNYRKHIQDTFGVDKELEAFHNVKKLKGEKHDETVWLWPLQRMIRVSRLMGIASTLVASMSITRTGRTTPSIISTSSVERSVTSRLVLSEMDICS